MKQHLIRIILSLVLVVAMVMTLASCGEAEDDSRRMTTETVYVLGPKPGTGWLGQAGTYAASKCEELEALGLKATYYSAESGLEQVSQCNEIIQNDDAASVVMMALDDDAEVGQESLLEADIPLIQFDLIFEKTEKRSAINYSGNNWQCGAGVAYWLQDQGMEQGSTVLVFLGDNSSVSTRRVEGFKNFLLGNDENEDFAKTGYYLDEREGEFFTTTKWSKENVENLFEKNVVLCNWSADVVRSYADENFASIINQAKNNDGKLYIYSMDDEMVFGLVDYLELASEDVKAEFEALDVYVASIGGMQEMYDLMNGDSIHSEIADTCFDEMMTMNFSPKMIEGAIDYAVKFQEGDVEIHTGTGIYAPTYFVDDSTSKSETGYIAGR